jgi:glucosamine--fructose-6-phosphate aminotransferase (isomerizing)
VYVNDHEIVVIRDGQLEIRSKEDVSQTPYIQKLEMELDSIEKGGYPHFMLKEIFEQPKALHDTLFSRIKDGKIVLNPKIQEALVNCTHLLITGCGTAYHAGMVAKYVIEHFAMVSVEVDIASELRYRTPMCKAGDVCILISQSGETADTIASLRLLKSLGVVTIALTNVVGSTISREADLVMYTQAGPEIAVASTKALTTQLMCLYIIALVMAKKETEALLEQLKLIPAQAQLLLEKQEDIQRFAARQFNKDKVFFMGRLTDYAISLESALKLKEISYTHSESFAAGELKHGPIALVDESTLVVAMCTQPSLFAKMDSNIKEVKARGATALVITFDTVREFDTTADEVFRIPTTEPYFTPMLTVIVSQLYAYYCSVLKGNDPDKPRNLAKSVTVE